MFASAVLPCTRLITTRLQHACWTATQPVSFLLLTTGLLSSWCMNRGFVIVTPSNGEGGGVGEVVFPLKHELRMLGKTADRGLLSSLSCWCHPQVISSSAANKGGAATSALHASIVHTSSSSCSCHTIRLRTSTIDSSSSRRSSFRLSAWRWRRQQRDCSTC